MGLAQRVVIYHRTVPSKMTSIGGERRSTAAAESAAKEVGSQSGWGKLTTASDNQCIQMGSTCHAIFP